MINAYGRLDYQREHLVKVQGTYAGPWGINFSAYYQFGSRDPVFAVLRSDEAGLGSLYPGLVPIFAERAAVLSSSPDQHLLDIRSGKDLPGLAAARSASSSTSTTSSTTTKRRASATRPTTIGSRTKAASLSTASWARATSSSDSSTDSDPHLSCSLRRQGRRLRRGAGLASIPKGGPHMSPGAVFGRSDDRPARPARVPGEIAGRALCPEPLLRPPLRRR